MGHRSIDNLRNLLAAKDAHDVIDTGDFEQQVVFLAFRQTAGDDDGADAALVLQSEHLADDAERFLARGFDEAASVDDDDIGAVRIGDQRVAVLSKFAEHALGIDQVFRATKADESKRLGCRLDSRCFAHHAPFGWAAASRGSTLSVRSSETSTCRSFASSGSSLRYVKIVTVD